MELMMVYIWEYLEKNDFIEISKNLTRYTDLKIILLDHQNNYVKNLIMINIAKSCDIRAISLSILYVLTIFWWSNKIIFRSISSYMEKTALLKYLKI